MTASGGAATEAAGPAGRPLQCLTHPNDVVAVSAAVEGIVESIAVDRGDLVEKGQVLVRLESDLEKSVTEAARARAVAESAMKSAQVRVDFGVRRFDRTQEMFNKELIPEKERDEAETAKLLAELAFLEAQENRILAELDLQRATAALEQRTIRSPIAGVVVERLLSPGEATGRGPVLKLAQLDPIRVETFVPVQMMSRMRPGMRAEVRLPAPVNAAHLARVTVVDRVVDPGSETVGVRLALPNPGYRLPAGLSCTLRFLDE